MRDWHLTADSPLSMRFAADVRLRQTDYADDQIWEVVFGKPEEPALSFQTRYGGRAGLARLVPMFVFDGKPTYESHLFHVKPVLTAFAPNYARITASPTDLLDLTAELWVMDSHAVGGRFHLTNKDEQPLTVRLELFAQIVRERQMINMNLLGLDDGSEALHLGVVGNLNPILLFEGAASMPTEVGAHISPKLSSPVTIQPGQTTILRWVHAGWPSLNNSLQAAYKWMNQINWDDAIKQIEILSESTPAIETGNTDWDAAIAFGTQVLLRSFVGPTQYLPNPSYVTARIPSRGFSPQGDGRDHGWQWNGQTALVGILALPSVASIAPDLARGGVKNAVATAKPDGWIDFKPGLGGQRANALSFPLWATTAWRVYEIVEDKRFLEDIYSLLVKFFERWFQTDVNHDNDALPEWTTAAQSGYGDNPIFARYRRWALNADISRAEAPDLAAYLISEANSLINMAQVLGQDATKVKERLDKLTQQLDMLWSKKANCYMYRDRDTHLTPEGQVLFKGKGDEAFDTKITLNPPNRLILRVIGGKEHTPKSTVTIEGLDAQGNPTAETISHIAFAWQYGMGSAISQQAYSQVNYVKFEGISRVYSVEIDTVDLSRHNQTLLLPLWTGATNQEQVQRLIEIATDPQRYWRTYGMPICPADDPTFAPNNENGSGGVWYLWNTLIIEGLLAHGATEQAMTLFTKLLDAQIKALRQDWAFRESYNSETGAGIGDLDELWGIVPLHLVMRLIGLRVVNRRCIWAGGLFLFPQAVKVTQHGIEITRSAKGTHVKFPSGHVAEVGAEWQLIEDPTPEPEPQLVVEPVAVPVPDQVSDLDDTEAIGLPETSSMIPVEAKKDDTLEVPISQIDFGSSADDNSDNSSNGPTVFKIPVTGSEE